MKANQPENVAQMPRTLLILAVTLLSILLLDACPAQRDATEAQSQQPVLNEDGSAAETAAAGSEADQARGPAQPGAAAAGGQADTGEGAADSADGAAVGDDDGADAAEQPLPPPEALAVQWELDGFSLGMSVEEARALLGPGMAGHTEERWAAEDYTGMIVAGTYAEPVKMQGSLLFLEGALVAVIASKIEELHVFNQRYTVLRTQLGEPVGAAPDWAVGRRFMAEMLAADPQPTQRYLWAQDATHALYIISYFEPDVLSSYMLADADKYDDVAAELEHALAAPLGGRYAAR